MYKILKKNKIKYINTPKKIRNIQRAGGSGGEGG